jgi:tetratricopeptide (TPR) repeat protein
MRADAVTAQDQAKPAEHTHVAQYSLLLLLTLCFCFATDLTAWFQKWAGNRADSSNLMEIAMGDARRLFANHFFVKADVYFHSGFYPSIYDNKQSFKTPHLAEDSGAMRGQNTGDEATFLGPPRNWIDRFGRQFFPSAHTHLTEGGANGKEKEVEAREILPWLKLSSELDPKRVETYAATAYWLRRIGKVKEAEDFLHEGLRQNPGSPLLLLDLGRLYRESRSDRDRARNVWEAGLRNLEKANDGQDSKDPKDQNKFVREQLLAALAKLEQESNHPDKALALLERLKLISPNPEAVSDWINDIQRGPKPGPASAPR